MAAYKNTEKIFLSVLRRGSDRAQIEREIAKLNKSDWQGLYELAFTSSLAPVFYRQMLSYNLENVPSDFLFKLKCWDISNQERNKLLLKRTLNICSIFKEANIPVIPLKGLFFAKYIYGDFTLSWFPADLDILVEPQERKRSERLIESQGFLTKEESRDGFHKFRSQITYFNSDKAQTIAIDLHWALRDELIPECTQDFWRNAKEVDFEGVRILAPANENLLLYLTFLAIYDGAVNIKYLYDMHSLVSKYLKDLNWPALAKKAKAFNLEAPLFLNLRLSREVFNTNLPPDSLEALNLSFIKKTICSFWINKNRLFKPNKRNIRFYLWYYLILNYLNSRGALDWIKRVKKKIFLPMEEAMWLSGRPASEASYKLYIKRLLKPFFKEK